MREGSLEAPVRHPIAWRDAEFTDPERLDAELRRAFDICHGCRRCFNLCDSFPKLFDLIDGSETGELDSVSSRDFGPVIDACTLCDMCFMVKCPYVPPHEFNLDFPHLMLRARAAKFQKGEVPAIQRQMTETDRNGHLGCKASGLANWACGCSNTMTRGLMQGVAGIDKRAMLPAFNARTLTAEAAAKAPPIDREAPAAGRKAVIFATCTGEFNNADIGLAAQKVLHRNGVETRVVYPGCCAMPQLEHGDIARVAEAALAVSAELLAWVDQGYDVISLVASCSLMLKFEWPLIVPEDEGVRRLAQATFDISEYVADIAAKEGLAPGLKALDGPVAMHIACHARAQNMGHKGAAMLRAIPDTEIKVIERCSGHGGSWGVMKDNFETALKIGKPVARDVAKQAPAYVVSECPLARDHILQGAEALEGGRPAADFDKHREARLQHPIQLLALAYGA